MFTMVNTAALFMSLLCAYARAQSATSVRATIDPETYPDFLKYAEYVSASTIQPCNRPPGGAVVVQEFSIASTDTQASIYRLDSNEEFILAFPGSASPLDFLTDLTVIGLPYPTARDCTGCLVHAGFANAFLSIAASLNATLQTAIQQYPSYTITITGGSLGGALGKLAFDYFKDSTIFSAKVTAGWSYGEPRVGNQAFADYTDDISGANDINIGLWHRVTHADDPIPQLPPRGLNFQHSRTELWERNAAVPGIPDPGDTFRCFGQEPTDCNDSQPSLDLVAHLGYAGYTLNACG